MISKRIQYGLHGERVHVECLAKAIPKPQHISWTHEGRAIAATDDDYTIQEDSLPGGLRSTLVINRVQERHFGTYNCTVMNAYGMAVSEIALQPRSRYPQLIQHSALENFKNQSRNIFISNSLDLIHILLV